jgi:hypothetical protein
MLSELAQLLLQQKAQAQQWSIDQYSGKHNMPSDIFARLPNSEVSKEVCIRSCSGVVQAAESTPSLDFKKAIPA